MNNKKMLLLILSFNFYKREEFDKFLAHYKISEEYADVNIAYDEYLEEVGKNYEFFKKNYSKTIISLNKFNKWLKDELKDKTYTVEEIQNKIKELELDLNIDGFNGD